MKVLPLCLCLLAGVVLAACDPTESSSSGNATGVVSIAGDADPSNPETYAGATLKAAGRFADRHGVTWRIVERDGESLPVTMDYNPERLNFSVQGRIVTEVKKG